MDLKTQNKFLSDKVEENLMMISQLDGLDIEN